MYILYLFYFKFYYLRKKKLDILYNLKLLFCYCSYVNYSNIAAKIVRRVLKPELQDSAAKRDETHIKFTPWVKGKPSSKKFNFLYLSIFKICF